MQRTTEEQMMEKNLLNDSRKAELDIWNQRARSAWTQAAAQVLIRMVGACMRFMKNKKSPPQRGAVGWGYAVTAGNSE